MNDYNNEINQLLSSLEPEFNDFHQLIKDMSEVKSPYQNEFNYMRSLANNEKFTHNLEGKINLLINELNHFGALLDKIVENDDVRELYINVGLLDKSQALQKKILSKFS